MRCVNFFLLFLSLSLPLLAAAIEPNLKAIGIKSEETASQEYFMAIIKSEKMKEYKEFKEIKETDVLSIIQTNTYSCLGCYRFEMSYKDVIGDQEQKAIFYTRFTNLGGPRILVHRKNK